MGQYFKTVQEDKILPRVPLSACLQGWKSDEEMSDYYSVAAGGKTTAVKRNRLVNFPPFLMVQLNRLVYLSRETVHELSKDMHYTNADHSGCWGIAYNVLRDAWCLAHFWKPPGLSRMVRERCILLYWKHIRVKVCNNMQCDCFKQYAHARLFQTKFSSGDWQDRILLIHLYLFQTDTLNGWGLLNYCSWSVHGWVQLVTWLA